MDDIDLTPEQEAALDRAWDKIEAAAEERRRLRKEKRKANGTAENPDPRHNLPVKE